MALSALVVAILAAAIAVTIHATMPTFGLMVVRLVASELSTYLIVFELVAIVTALIAARDATRVITVGIVLAGIVLAAAPLMALPGAIAAADEALTAIGSNGPMAAFSATQLFTGIHPPAVHRVNDITFRTIDGTALRLDRYDGVGAGTHPALVVVHGGSWRNGDKGAGALDPIVANEMFAAQGITVYDIQYRLVPAAIFPAQLEDVLCALGHIRAHAAEDGVDPDRAAILGRSAGAHLALLAAYGAGRNATPAGCAAPARIRGVISLYGPTDLAAGYRVPAMPDLIGGSAAIADFMGGAPDAVPDRYLAAAPQNALGHPVPPTLLIHGQADQVVKPDHSESLAAALRRGGHAVALIELPWAGHGFDGIVWGIGGQLALASMLRFLDHVL